MSEETRLNFDGSVHVCRFNVEGRCVDHVFTRSLIPTDLRCARCGADTSRLYGRGPCPECVKREILERFAVGDTVRLKEQFSANGRDPVTITELTDRGFKYKHPRRMLNPYSWSEGGETFRPDMYERTTPAVRERADLISELRQRQQTKFWTSTDGTLEARAADALERLCAELDAVATWYGLENEAARKRGTRTADETPEKVQR